jgi:hypothetical protein
MLLLSAFMVFKFFGGAGLNRYGEASHWISALSVYVLLPLAGALGWPHGSIRRQFASPV